MTTANTHHRVVELLNRAASSVGLEFFDLLLGAIAAAANADPRVDFDDCFALLRQQLRLWLDAAPASVARQYVEACFIEFVAAFTPDAGPWYPLYSSGGDDAAVVAEWFCEDHDVLAAIQDADPSVLPRGLKVSPAHAAALLLDRLDRRGWRNVA